MKKQIPVGNDRKKGNSKNKSKGKSNNQCGGPSAAPQDDGKKHTTATARATAEADPCGMTTRKAKATTLLDGVEGLAAVDGFG